MPRGGCSRRALLRGRAAAGRPPGPRAPTGPDRGGGRSWPRPRGGPAAQQSAGPAPGTGQPGCSYLWHGAPDLISSSKKQQQKYTNQKENSYLIKVLAPYLIKALKCCY